MQHYAYANAGCLLNKLAIMFFLKVLPGFRILGLHILKGTLVEAYAPNSVRISRSMSRFLMASFLSYFFFPLANPNSSFTLPLFS